MTPCPLCGARETANIQPHEILSRLRGARNVPRQETTTQRTMALRETVEGNVALRAAKTVANAVLSATGSGDTIRALAERG